MPPKKQAITNNGIYAITNMQQPIITNIGIHAIAKMQQPIITNNGIHAVAATRSNSLGFSQK